MGAIERQKNVRPTISFATSDRHIYCRFLLSPIKLVIEIDGGIHTTKEQQEYDIGRTAELNYWEIEVIRFTNEEIEKDIYSVLEEIKRVCLIRQSEIQKSPL